MKRIIILLFIPLYFLACNNSKGKNDINNIEIQRQYQDSILDKSSNNPKSYKEALESLITYYNNIKNTDTSAKINTTYYLARLYSNIFSYPMFANVYDSSSNKFTDTITYIKYKDSARMLSKEILDKDPNNIRAFYIYSNELYWEWMYYVNSKNKAPFYGANANIDFLNSLTYITENAPKFNDIDTSKSKQISQEISEYAYFFVAGGLLNFKFNEVDYTNKSNLKAYITLEKLTNILDKKDSFLILDKHSYNENKNSIVNVYKTAKVKLDDILKKEFQEAEIAKNTITIDHDASKDWNDDATIRKTGEEVWNACHDNPNAIKIILNIKNGCKDAKGNGPNYISKIISNKSEISEYRKYQDAYTFNKYCTSFAIKLLSEYKPCGFTSLLERIH